MTRPAKLGDLLFLISVHFVPFVNANINFHWVQPTCDVAMVGTQGSCLSGQICVAPSSCVASASISTRARDKQKREFSIDGRCGPMFGNLLCDPKSSDYHGACCSKHGWCGDTRDHCLQGCVSGCWDLTENISIVPGQEPGKSPVKALGEPIVGQGANGAVTTDGSCGAASGGTVCGDWYKGSCCSMYGFCGNTSGHCGVGCQSGPCYGDENTAAPGPSPVPVNSNPGSFAIVGQSGVPAMHAGLMENGRVFFLDKVENYTQLNLTDGQFAYSSEYDPATNQAVPLGYKTNAFCSGGSFLADGRVISVGGNAPLTFIDPTVGDGFTAIRYLQRSVTNSSLNGQNWSEPGNKLSSARWYASAQTMPDGTVFVASGSLNGLDPSNASNNNPTYEVLDQGGMSSGQSIAMDILENNQPYYMYPFLHLLSDGSLFVFASKSAELFDVTTGSTWKDLPDLPGNYRTYPNTGGSVILPFSSSNGWQPDVIICGGGPYQAISAPADASCGRIQPLAHDANWEMDSMPEGRVMVEGTLLPDGTVIWLNGCTYGGQGFGLGADPAYEALIYDPTQPLGQRFTSGANSSIARLYHSVALLLLDGTIMVAGSNPVEQPILQPDAQNPYVTEFRVEIYTPPYLSGDRASQRPIDIQLSTTSLSADGSKFQVSFTAPSAATSASVVLYHGGFITHSLHMGQRIAVLDFDGWTSGATEQSLTVCMPPNRNVSPPGPWVIYVLCDGVPGIGQFVSVS